MAYYIKNFKNISSYNDYINDNPLLPNVSLVGKRTVRYTPIPPPPVEAGDIVYHNGNELKFCRQTNWDSNIGTPVAIVVVPEGHTSDGTVRAMCITDIYYNGYADMNWGPQVDTILPNLDKVPTWSNEIGGDKGNNSYGYLSSNKEGLTGKFDALDNNLKYYNDAGPFIPNPYLPDGSPNPDYRNTVEATTANCLSDFDGLGNTAVLVSLGTAYTAANVCYNYSTPGIPVSQWYLPTMGELGYIMPRYNQIQSALTIINGAQLNGLSYYWSSNEYNSVRKYCLDIRDSLVYIYNGVYGASNVRAFCSIPLSLGF